MLFLLPSLPLPLQFSAQLSNFLEFQLFNFELSFDFVHFLIVIFDPIELPRRLDFLSLNCLLQIALITTSIDRLPFLLDQHLILDLIAVVLTDELHFILRQLLLHLFLQMIFYRLQLILKFSVKLLFNLFGCRLKQLALVDLLNRLTVDWPRI